MHPHRYRLESHTGKSNTKYTCPSCGQRNKLTRYIDTHTGEYVADHVGRCDRQDKCAYHQRPSEYLRGHQPLSAAAPATALRSAIRGTPAQAAASYIAHEHLQRSMMHYADNHFVQYLYSFGYERSLVHRCILDYRIGTSAHWPGATVFWQMDTEQRIHTGKVMLYDRTTGSRVRQPFSHISWAHTVLGLEDFHLQQCLFGLHLLTRDTSKPIAITESEKSAVIASIFMPQFTWMAVGGKEMLTAEKLRPLQGRTVYLYPDHGGYDLWQRKAQELSGIVPMYVSDMMETEGSSGDDVADYLIRCQGKN